VQRGQEATFSTAFSSVPRYYKTEAVVLRSIRLREADRVLHLYTSSRGRVGAVAKGIRRTRSRFGGRLEPFFRLRLMLYEGRGELHTVTGAETIECYPRLREHGASLSAATSACESVLRLLGEGEANVAAYNLLCRELQLLDSDPSAAGPANVLAFRLKLLLASGFLPELSSCTSCGAGDGIALFSASAGGVVCRDCSEGDGFDLGREAHSFMTTAIAAPLQELPAAAPGALAQVDRAVAGTLEHHAHVRLRSVA
jgi:DNA repair protein RecO (recombination protein O)